MKHPRQQNPRPLTRNSTGLTAAHVALIKILAAQAVEEFLSETETIKESPASVKAEESVKERREKP